MKKTLIIGLVMLTFFFVACKKSHLNAVNDKKAEEITISAKWDSYTPKVSGIISSFLKDKFFRDYLKTEVLKAFDGDYDVLLSKIVNDLKAFNNQTVQSRTAQTMVFDEQQLAYLTDVSNDFPQMQVAVQVDPNDWNTETILLRLFIQLQIMMKLQHQWSQ